VDAQRIGSLCGLRSGSVIAQHPCQATRSRSLDRTASYAADPPAQHPTEGFAFVSEKAHKATVWLGRHTPGNRDVFLTAGGNGGLNLYKCVV
jgi:hypothetical protein